MPDKLKHDEIYKRLTTVFHDVFDDDSIVLRDETSALEIPQWDSLTHITLCVAVEREFNTRLSATEIGRLANVGALVALLSKKCS